MTPMSMTYHESVLASLRREAAVERMVRRNVPSRGHPHRFSVRIFDVVRAPVAPQA